MQLLLGIVGLLEPEITVEDESVRVSAVATPYRPLSSIEEYTKGLFFIQKLYPEAEEVSLGVESQGEWYCSLHAPAKSIEALVRKPDEAELLKLLLKAGISSAGQPERSDEEKLVELGLSLGSKLVVLRLREAVEAIADPMRHSDLDRSLSQGISFLKDIEDALRTPLDVSPTMKQKRNSFVGAMKDVRHFFSIVLRVRRGRSDAGAISRANKRYVKALNFIDHLAETLPPVERIF